MDLPDKLKEVIQPLKFEKPTDNLMFEGLMNDADNDICDMIILSDDEENYNIKTHMLSDIGLEMISDSNLAICDAYKNNDIKLNERLANVMIFNNIINVVESFKNKIVSTSVLSFSNYWNFMNSKYFNINTSYNENPATIFKDLMYSERSKRINAIINDHIQTLRYSHLENGGMIDLETGTVKQEFSNEFCFINNYTSITLSIFISNLAIEAINRYLFDIISCTTNDIYKHEVIDSLCMSSDIIKAFTISNNSGLDLQIIIDTFVENSIKPSLYDWTQKSIMSSMMGILDSVAITFFNYPSDMMGPGRLHFEDEDQYDDQ